MRPGDTPETLAERLLDDEHRLLVATVGLIAAGRLAFDGARVLLDGAPIAAPLRLGEERLTVA